MEISLRFAWKTMGNGVLPVALRGVLEESPRTFFGSGKRAIGADNG